MEKRYKEIKSNVFFKKNALKLLVGRSSQLDEVINGPLLQGASGQIRQGR
jgi:hypothetical protein